MSETRYISGFRKLLVELWIILRLYYYGIAYFGFSSFFKEIKKYRKDKRNVFVDMPNRLVKNRGNIYVLPDVPAVNKNQFIRYLINDIEFVNNKKKLPMLFTILCISSRCPYKCPYCYNSNEHCKEEQIPIETLKKCIAGLIDNEVKNIYLSGGEPMMRWAEIPELLEPFNTEEVGFWMLTTGWSIDKEKIAAIKKIGIRGIMVSLDSINKSDIDNTKSAGAFENATNAIRLACNEGLMVAIDAVFGRNLLEEDNFKSFILSAAELGANFINCYSPRQISEELSFNQKPFGLEEYKKIEKLTKNNLRNKENKNMPLSYSPDMWEAKRGCVGGKLFVYISPSGELKTCPFNKKVYGNIKEESITDILETISNSNFVEICKANEILKEELSLFI